MAAVLWKAVVFLCIILLGAGLRSWKILKRSDFGILAKIVLNVTLPCAVVSNFAKLDVDFSLILLAPIGLGCNLLLMGAGWLFSRKGTAEERTYSLLNYPGYNIGCFTMPYIQSFLGPSAVISACLFDAGNAVVCTGGSYALAAAISGTEKGFPVKKFLKRLFSSVTLDTYLVMLALAALKVKLPGPVVQFAETAGGANAFLAMLMIGVGFEIHLDKSRLKRLAQNLLVRFGLSALLSAALYFFTPFPLAARQLLAIIVFSPIASASPAFTGQLGGDIELASTVNSLSIVIGMSIMTGLIMAMGIS